jgi:threonine dehydrogenase-like Zn-dependent dehydrogenase
VKAALIGADRALTVADIERPVPAVGEVLIDVRYCGICASDLHMLGMPADLVPAGHVLGHELTGVVAELGPASPAGRPASGSWCSRWSPADSATPAAPAIPTCASRAASTTARASAARAATRSRWRCRPGCCAGPIGVLAVAGLLAAGFERIAVVEPGPGRRAAAERLGVHAAGPDEAADKIPGLLGGQRPTVVIDTTGHPSGAPLALRLLPAAGRLTVVGLPAARPRWT